MWSCIDRIVGFRTPVLSLHTFRTRRIDVLVATSVSPVSGRVLLLLLISCLTKYFYPRCYERYFIIFLFFLLILFHYSFVDDYPFSQCMFVACIHLLDAQFIEIIFRNLVFFSLSNEYQPSCFNYLKCIYVCDMYVFCMYL